MMGAMRFLDRMEKKCGWLAFPGFLKFYAILHLLVFLLQFVRKDMTQLLDFDRQRILGGEVWRLVTFVFASAGSQGQGPFTILFYIFGMMLVFMISDALEGAWGAFRTSLFCYTGWLMLVVANFICPAVPAMNGLHFYGAAFLAFATVFPKFELRLYFVLPVQVRFLGMLQGLLILLSIFGRPVYVLFYLLALLNYLLWAAIPALRGQALMMQSAQRRRSFNAAKGPKDEAFHRCQVCNRTEVSDPVLEFRIGADGAEYCADHLPEQR